MNWAGGSREGTPSPDDAAAAEAAAKEEDDLTEEERIALLGKPRLGDLVAINVHIRESTEFKVREIVLLVVMLFVDTDCSRSHAKGRLHADACTTRVRHTCTRVSANETWKSYFVKIPMVKNHKVSIFLLIYTNG